MTISTNDILQIHATDPLASIYLYSVPNCKLKHYIDGEFQNEYKADNIYFIDFGAASGYIELIPLVETNLIVDVFVFPTECEQTRYVTNFSPVKLNLDAKSKDEKFLIKNEQVFCYWPILYGEKSFNLDLNSEKNYDTFKLMLHSTDQLTLSGKLKREITYNSTLYWFKWASDNYNLSNYARLSSTSNQEHSAKLDFYSDRTVLSKIVILKHNLNTNPSYKRILVIIYVSASVGLLLIIAGIVLIIYLRKRKSKTEFQQEDDDQELLDGFVHVPDSRSFPTPISFD